MMSELVRYINPAQKAFAESSPGSPFLFLGGFGTGKSRGGTLKILYLADKYPNSRWAIVRRSHTQLIKTTLQTLFSLLPASRLEKVDHQNGIYTLTNGSIIYALHLDQPNSLEVLRSLELNGAFVDQAEEISEAAFDLLDTRCGRWSHGKRRGGYPASWPYKDQSGCPIVPRYLLLAANSPGFDNWVTKRYWSESKELEKYQALGYRMVRASSRENPKLSKQYLDTLLSKGESFVRRFVDVIDWGSVEGTIFTISDLSIIDPDVNPGLLQKIIGTMKLHRSLDHGETAPTCCGWHGTDSEGNIFTYREYYQPNKLVSEHRKAIFELSKADALQSTRIVPHYHSNIADPSVTSKSRGRTLNTGPRWSVADEYADTRLMSKETSIYWIGAENDESVTRSRLKEYLAVDPEHRHPVTGQKGAPRLYFIKKTKNYPNGCDKVISEIQGQRLVEIGETSEGRKMFSDERDDKIVDHAYDMEKYFTVGRPSLGEVSPQPEAPPGSIRLDDYDRMVKEQASTRRRDDRRNDRSATY